MKLKFKDWLFVKLWGEDGIEFILMDMTLASFRDGFPRIDLPVTFDETARIEHRAFKYLVDNNLLEPYDNGFVITALGRMHLSKGGCRGEFLHHKLRRLSFILSLIATTLSIIAMIIALGK